MKRSQSLFVFVLCLTTAQKHSFWLCLSERVVVVSREAEVEPEPVASIEEEDVDNVAEVYDDPCEKDEGVVVDVEPIVEPPPAKLNHSEVLSVSHGDPPTYASIVSLLTA